MRIPSRIYPWSNIKSTSNLFIMDTILAELIKKYEQRSESGIKKYGTTLDRDDLLLRDWLIHLQEELMDASLYGTKIINYINLLEKNNDNENF